MQRARCIVSWPIRNAGRSDPEGADGHGAAVWSWDITRLLGPKKWSYYYLYVIMATAATSWAMVADREKADADCLKHGVRCRSPDPDGGSGNSRNDES